jgi:hypothetical protein
MPLRDFLTENGVRYDMCALNEKTHKTMWVYVRTNKLNKLLETWSLRKPD